MLVYMANNFPETWAPSGLQQHMALGSNLTFEEFSAVQVDQFKLDLQQSKLLPRDLAA